MNAKECCNQNCNQGRDCPLRKKELTDEEIEEVEKSCKQPLASWSWQVEFARAILRKAQK